ncbi:hypothetical protein VTK26DRAFT_8123 [Humicola hyalothermophila]
MADPRANSKRSACDRCRTQKLRCLRVEWHPADSCLRCVRSGADCVTTSTKRPGRPPRNPTNNPPRPPTIPSPRTSPSTTGTNGSSNDPVPAEMAVDPVDDWFNLDALESQYDISSTYWAFADLSELHHHGVAACGTDNGRAAFSMHSPAALSIITHGATSSDHPIDPFLSDARLDLSTEVPDRAHHDVSRHAHPASPPTCDQGLWLSAFYRDLSKLLFTLRSEPWDITEAVQLTCGYDGLSPGMTSATAFPLHHEQSNPLAKITKRSAEFANLLRSVQAPAASLSRTTEHTPPHASAPMSISPPPTPTHPRLTIADLLTSLSCHMLLLSIYDTILAHFLNHHTPHLQTGIASTNPASKPPTAPNSRPGTRAGTGGRTGRGISQALPSPANNNSSSSSSSSNNSNNSNNLTHNTATAPATGNPAATPTLYLGGVPIPTSCQWKWWPSALVGHLLVCLIEAHLRPVEVLLGLPEEFCVAAAAAAAAAAGAPLVHDGDAGAGSGAMMVAEAGGLEAGGEAAGPGTTNGGVEGGGMRGRGGGGLFGGASGRSLFAALMQVETERAVGAGGEDGGLGVVESLRERMRRVQGLGR